MITTTIALAAITAALSSYAAGPAPSPAPAALCSFPPGGTAVEFGGAVVGARYADLRYSGTASGPAYQLLDMLIPNNWTGSFEYTLLFVHGGGGPGDSKFEPIYRPYLAAFLALGVPVITMNYAPFTSTPDSDGDGQDEIDLSSYPGAIHDVKLAINWLRTSQVAADACLPTELYAMGSSLGASISLMAGQTWAETNGAFYAPTFVAPDGVATLLDHSSPNLKLDGVISFSGLCDMYKLGLAGACASPACPNSTGQDPNQCPLPGGPQDGWLARFQEGQLNNYENYVGAFWEDVPHTKPWNISNGSGTIFYSNKIYANPTNSLLADPFLESSPWNWIGGTGEDPPVFLIHSACDPISPQLMLDRYVAFASTDLLPGTSTPKVQSMILNAPSNSTGHGIQGSGPPMDTANPVVNRISDW